MRPVYRYLSREMNARAMVSKSAYEARSERLGVTCVANFMRWRPRPLRRRNSLQFQGLRLLAELQCSVGSSCHGLHVLRLVTQ